MSTILMSKDNLTLDDFLQLQSLLTHEQGECDKHIEACHQQNKTHVHPVHHHHPIKFRRAINPQAARESQLEKQRLAQALLTLQHLKDQYRRQRAIEIQSYLEEYRRQALIRAVLQEEEERYYRQCIAAALEQRRVNLLWQKFVDAKRQEALVQKLQDQQLYDEQRQQEEQEQAVQGNMSSSSGSEDDDGYSDYHSEQLANLLKQIFGQQQQQQQQEPEESRERPTAAASSTNTDKDTDNAMAEVWNYLNDQKTDAETPRTAFLSSEQDRVLGAGKEKEVSESDQQQEAESIGSPASSPENERIKALPPLQDHVLTLQDLIQKLAAEPVQIGEEYHKYDNAPEQADAVIESLPKNFSSNEDTEIKYADLRQNEQEKEKKPFLPQHIFTEAEPTPTLESMPNTPLDNASIKEDSHFVDTVAAEQQNHEIPADPRKEKANEQLDHISDQLSQSSELVKRWSEVVSHANQLSFSKQQEGTLLLTASTDANRQFLGSEDEIMRVMLKLDSVDSFGNDDIRQKRKSLVKKCEHMLEELDQVKKTQWEKALSFNKQGPRRRRRHNKKH